MKLEIRKATPPDVPQLKTVIAEAELFPPEMLEELMSDFFNETESTDIWLTVTAAGQPVAIAYCAPERMTNGTYNLYAIGTLLAWRGKGIGTILMEHIEDLLRKKGVRILLVETSGVPAFEQTRNFYRKCSYHHEATIREFYDAGDDKVIFWKALS